MPSSNSDRTQFIRQGDLQISGHHAAVLQANGLDSLEALFTVPHGEPLNKPGLSAWRERLRLSLSDGGVSRTYYLKRFHCPPVAARRALRASRTEASSLAGLEWAWMLRLARDGVACPDPVALGEELRGSREVRSAIVTAAVPGRSLEAWVDGWDGLAEPAVRALLDPLAALVARLHRAGYFHRDLYFSHVFWDPAAPITESLHLIDLQRVLQPRWHRRRWRVKDLAALNFSADLAAVSGTDRLRWLKHYLGVRKLDTSAKVLAHLVLGKTRSIARHERRRVARFRRRSEVQ